MGIETGISWCDSTFNVVWGCTKISPGCKNCYALELSTQYGFNCWGTNPRRILSANYWNNPYKWNDAAKKEGKVKLVFTSSMCDNCEDNPVVASQLKRLWSVIRDTEWIAWQFLTKRADRLKECLPEDWEDGYPNVWIGTSVENNDYVWRLDHLRAIPAVCRFISYEPALGPLPSIDLSGIDWVIYGGESGPSYRDHDYQWARDIHIKCNLAGIPFYYKQSPSRFSGNKIELDGKVIQNFPLPRRVSRTKVEPQVRLNHYG